MLTNIEIEIDEQISCFRSLTTPSCSEAVRRFVVRGANEILLLQGAKFLSNIHENARPVQRVNARFLLNSK